MQFSSEQLSKEEELRNKRREKELIDTAFEKVRSNIESGILFRSDDEVREALASRGVPEYLLEELTDKVCNNSTER